MKCPYLNCRIRTNEDLCNLRAEGCRIYNINKRNEAEIKEIEAKAFKRGHIRKLSEDIKMCNKAYDKGKQEALKQISDWIEVNKWWTNQGSLVISYTSLIDKMEKLK